MKITMSGKGMSIGEQLKHKIETKMAKFDRYFGPDAEAHVKAKTDGDEKVIEITVRVQQHIYRAEAEAEDIFSSLDRAMAGLERQIRKQKSKIEKKIREFSYMKEALWAEPSFYDEKEDEPHVVKRKEIELTPQTEEEAALQMELLGHRFHLFLNAQTDQVDLLYKRKDGHYGLISVK